MSVGGIDEELLLMGLGVEFRIMAASVLTGTMMYMAAHSASGYVENENPRYLLLYQRPVDTISSTVL